MSIDKRPNGKYRARWREYPGGPQTSRTFDRKRDAQVFLTTVMHSVLSGSYVDPKAGKVTVAAYYAMWLDRMRPTWRPSTAELVEAHFRNHVIPSLGARPIGSIKKADVEAWASSLKLQPGTVATVRQHFGQLLNAAVEDGVIARSPAHRARMPRIEDSKAKPIPYDDIDAILAACPDDFRVAVYLGAGLGLRQAETTGLTIDKVDFLRRSVQVDRQLLSKKGGGTAFAPLKTSSSYRPIPLPQFVGEAISAHVAAHGPGEGGVIVHTAGGVAMSAKRFGAAWRAAVEASGVPPCRYHDLRHTFASTLLSEGVSIKAVANWLGHASPTTTLATYSHLMPVDDDRGRRALEVAFGRAESQLRTATA